MSTPANGADTPVSKSALGCITVPLLLVAIVVLAWGGRSQWEKGELSRKGEAAGDAAPARPSS